MIDKWVERGDTLGGCFLFRIFKRTVVKYLLKHKIMLWGIQCAQHKHKQNSSTNRPLRVNMTI